MMKGGENVKRLIALVMIVCFITVGIAIANDEPQVPDTIAAPELLGPHYYWKAKPADDKDETDTNIQDRVKEGTITPGTEDRIKEAVDAQRSN